MNYFSFVRQHLGFLFFGFTMMGLSNFGNTFFIALHSDAIKATFGLSNTSFGGLYSAMTLLSALVMLFTGRYIDKWRLSRFTVFVFFGFATGCLLMGFANHIIVLAMALFLLRHFGQGLSSHTGSTATARAFPHQRGRAVAIIQLGYASTEAIFPLLLVLALGYMSWQGSWLLTAGLLVFVILPYQLFLTRYEPPRNAEAMLAADGSKAAGRRDVLRDKRFYLLVPLYTSAPFLLTGMFFHQLALAEAYQWSLLSLASAFTLYAVVKIITSLLAGWLIDRFSAIRLFPFVCLPLMAAFCVLLVPAVGESGFGLYLYMTLIAINLGFAAPMSGALWPDLFGAQNLGAIRSMIMSIVIIATAAAPVFFGALIDAGISFQTIAQGSLIYLFVCAVLAFLASRFTLASKQGEIYE